MKIVADIDVPFLKGVFEPWAEVIYKKGTEIGRDDVIDADVLIIRTRTRCDAALLDGTKVQMIATATIGMDHIDMDYCKAHGIEVSNSAGCNSGGVMQPVAQLCLTLCAPRTAARQASLSITNSRSLLKLMSTLPL